MNDNFACLPEPELPHLIERAEKHRKDASRGKLKKELQEKPRLSGIDLGGLFPETGGRIREARAAADEGEAKEMQPTYRHPDSQKTWSGRGARPSLWAKRRMAECGWTLDDVKTSDEYEA